MNEWNRWFLILPHVGHDLEVIMYGDDDDRPFDKVATVECNTCGDVLWSARHPGSDEIRHEAFLRTTKGDDD